MRHTLESQKLFPVVAWILVISFAAFVGHLALTLNETADSLTSYSYDVDITSLQ